MTHRRSWSHSFLVYLRKIADEPLIHNKSDAASVLLIGASQTRNDQSITLSNHTGTWQIVGTLAGVKAEDIAFPPKRYVPVSQLDQCTVSTDSRRNSHTDVDDNKQFFIIKSVIKGASMHSGQYQAHECMHLDLQRWTTASHIYMHEAYFMRLVHDLT